SIKENGNHRVKLHFMEPEEIGSGKRVFDVSLQGETVLSDLDLSHLAGGSRKAIVKEFEVEVKDQILRMEFSTHTELPAVLSGVEWHRLP
ncbi:MAG: malectin domain-containing carbohydrate-binding protein, partial [Opitutales bacterium]